MSGFSSAPRGWRTLKTQNLDGMPPSLFFDVPDIDKFGMSTLRIWGGMSGKWDNHWSQVCLLDDTGAEVRLSHESFSTGTLLFDLEIKKSNGLTYTREKLHTASNGLTADARAWKPQHTNNWTKKNITGFRIKAYNSGRFPMPAYGPSFVVVEGKP